MPSDPDLIDFFHSADGPFNESRIEIVVFEYLDRILSDKGKGSLLILEK